MTLQIGPGRSPPAHVHEYPLSIIGIALESYAVSTLNPRPTQQHPWTTAQQTIVKYIEVFYKRQRRHSALDHGSLVEDAKAAQTAARVPRIHETWGSSK